MGLKNIIKKWLLSNDAFPDKEYMNSGLVASSGATNFYDEAAFRFTIRPASGGHVIEVISNSSGMSMSKQRAQGPSSSLYVIHEDKDLGTELSKILTIETLKS